MPITARLSQHFYERFGDEATNELVDWLNSVDATYRSDLRELNEQNFARFDAKLERRLAEFESRILRWMFTFWTGQTVALAALMYAMLHGK